MKMKTLLAGLTCLIILTGFSCKKRDSISSCIQDKIDDLKAKPKYNPPARVIQYDYNGKKVYYITSDCCDQYNFLYDDNCKVVCAPDGGFTGGGDGKCGDFQTKKTNEKIIWQDSR